jgi:hypothetical protein
MRRLAEGAFALALLVCAPAAAYAQVLLARFVTAERAIRLLIERTSRWDASFVAC